MMPGMNTPGRSLHVGVCYDLGPIFVDKLRLSFPDIQFTLACTPSEQRKVAPEVDVIFGSLDRKAFVSASRLRWYHFIGIGFDSVLRQVPEFKDSGVIMTNARGTHVIPMSEYAMGMMLSLAHHLRESLEDQAARRWRTKFYSGRILELAGATLGILAFGDIGQAVARRALAFEMQVYAVDLAPIACPPGVRAVWPIDRLNDMLERTDWLVITAPRTAATERKIGADELARLRSGAHIVVVSRGGILDEQELIAAIDRGHIAGAAIDATSVEPPPNNSPLWDHPRVYLTSHVSAESSQLLVRRGDIFIENLRRYIAGDELLNRCDMERGY